MSVFKVKLTQGDQGNLDEVAAGVNHLPGGTVAAGTGVSIQRSVYVMGPRKVNRLLKDGDTFTDSNYWKRFAYPQTTREKAIVEVVTDDGSDYVDGNFGQPGQSNAVAVYNLTIPQATVYGDAGTYADILSDYGSHASYVQVTASSQNVKMRINGTAIIDVLTTTVQVFNPGDMDITLLEFQSPNGQATVEVLVGVAIKNNS